MASLLKKSFIFGATFLFLVSAAYADQFDDLTARFSGTLQTLRASTFTNGVYVAVGDNGTILTSADSVTWLPRLSGTTNRLNAIRYGTNGFVVVGEAATILNSPDGLVWTQVACPVTNNLSGVTYSNGRYVAVGSKGLILTSTNAANWTPILTGAPYDLNAVEVGLANVVAEQFVAVGDSGLVMTSPTGLAWTARTYGVFNNLRAVAQWKRIWVTVGDSGTVATSPDGITWTARSSATSKNLRGIGSDGRNDFGAVGDDGVFMVSTNGGSSWTLASSGTTNRLYGMYYANAAHMAVGEAGTIQSGYVFLPRNPGTDTDLYQIAYGNGKYVVVGAGTILSSTNGSKWTIVAQGTNAQVVSVVFGNGQFVAVGANGTIKTSTNGSSWANHNVGKTNSLSSIVFAKQTFTVGGYYPGKNSIPVRMAITSTNGRNWNSISVPAFLPTRTMQASNLWIGINGGPAPATSSNGTKWVIQPTSAQNGLSAVAYGNGLFAAVGGRDLSMPTQIFSSPDATNWTSRSSGSASDSSLAFGGPGFVAVGQMFDFFQPVLHTSSDGITWTMRGINGRGINSEGIDPPYGDILFINGSFLTVGGGGAMAQSVPSNARALPRITTTLTNGQVLITAIAQPGYSYRIQKSTNPASSNWNDAFTFTSTQTLTNFVITGGSSGNSFYRIVSP